MNIVLGPGLELQQRLRIKRYIKGLSKRQHNAILHSDGGQRHVVSIEHGHNQCVLMLDGQSNA